MVGWTFPASSRPSSPGPRRKPLRCPTGEKMQKKPAGTYPAGFFCKCYVPASNLSMQPPYRKLCALHRAHRFLMAAVLVPWRGSEAAPCTCPTAWRWCAAHATLAATAQPAQTVWWSVSWSSSLQQRERRLLITSRKSGQSCRHRQSEPCPPWPSHQRPGQW